MNEGEIVGGGCLLLPDDDSGSSGCRTFDVLFKAPLSTWNAIHFNNEHTYSISIFSQSNMCTNWEILLLDHVLMLNPHSAGKCSENWITLLRDNFLVKMESIVRLRILLKQPSPHWSEFGIANFAIVYRKEQVDKNYVGIASRHLKLYEIDLLQ